MPDLSLSGMWGGDLATTASGDIQTVDGSTLGVQRVLRRLFTAERALLFHPDYGAGLLAKIGSPINIKTIQGICRAQMFREAAVSQNPPPTVEVREVGVGSGKDIINIHYQDRPSGAPMLLAFDPSVTPPGG